MNQTILQHHGIKGMKWGVRRYQNKDGSLTSAGKKRLQQQKSEFEKDLAPLQKDLESIRPMIQDPQYVEYYNIMINEIKDLRTGKFDTIQDAELVELISMEAEEFIEDVKEKKLTHHGIKGMKWGVRRYQNPDGSLTPRGRARLDKKDTKWAETKGEKIRVKTQKTVSKEMDNFVKTQLEMSYTSTGRISSATILQYNNKLASLMNERVSGIQAPSGRVLKFVAKRGEIGVHTAVADAGYDMEQLRRGVFKSGKVAYKKENLMRKGD